MTNSEAIARLQAAIDIATATGCQLAEMSAADAIKIINLLKKQEPVLLQNQHKPYGHFTNANAPWISRCPKCSKKVEGRQTRFCK